MPAVTPSQQRLFGQAYAIKTGDLKPEDLNPEYRDQIVKLADSMTLKQLKDYAETKHSEMKKENTEYKMKNIPTFESFVNESKIDTKYWMTYNQDTSGGQMPKHHSILSKDFEDTFEDAISEWQDEADETLNSSEIKKIRAIADQFFKIEKKISIAIIHAMIAQS